MPTLAQDACHGVVPLSPNRTAPWHVVVRGRADNRYRYPEAGRTPGPVSSGASARRLRATPRARFAGTTGLAEPHNTVARRRARFGLTTAIATPKRGEHQDQRRAGRVLDACAQRPACGLRAPRDRPNWGLAHPTGGRKYPLPNASARALASREGAGPAGRAGAKQRA